MSERGSEVTSGPIGQAALSFAVPLGESGAPSDRELVVARLAPLLEQIEAEAIIATIGGDPRFLDRFLRAHAAEFGTLGALLVYVLADRARFDLVRHWPLIPARLERALVDLGHASPS